jgi:hypothetical protein
MQTAWDCILSALDDTSDFPGDLGRNILQNLAGEVLKVKVITLSASSAVRVLPHAMSSPLMFRQTTRVDTELDLLERPFAQGTCISVLVELVVDCASGQR